MCPGSRGAGVSRPACPLAAAVRVFPSPAVPPQPCPGGGAGPSAMAALPPAPAGHDARAHGEIRPTPRPVPSLSSASCGTGTSRAATGTRGSGTGVNGVTPAGKDQVLSRQPAAGRLNRGLRRAGRLLLLLKFGAAAAGSSPGPPRVPGPAARRVFIFALGRALCTLPAAFISRHYLQIFTWPLSHCKTASMPTWCSQAGSGVL